VSTAPLWPAPADAQLGKQTAARLQAELKSSVAAHDKIGATAAVVTTKGVWAGAVGVDGVKAKLTATTAMSICSITKTFVAAEVMKLSGLGKVNLDAPLSEYVTAPFDTSKATVRQVLGMRSGFPDEPKLDSKIQANLDHEWTATEVLGHMDGESSAEPGGSPVYNNANYWLLGQLIEKVTGQPLAATLRQDLINPAGLKRAWVQTAEKPVPPLGIGTDNLADSTNIIDAKSGYLPSRAGASVWGSAGAVAGDASAVARWGYLLYGGHVITSDLVSQMITSPAGEVMGDGPVGYGLGTMTLEDPLIVGHAGCGGDIYSTQLLVWPGSATAVAILTPQPNDGDFTFEYELASALAGKANM
jgi:D-alanyl-D-alanine carboxypeptidase